MTSHEYLLLLYMSRLSSLGLSLGSGLGLRARQRVTALIWELLYAAAVLEENSSVDDAAAVDGD